MEYVLPIGATRNDGRVDYKIRNGLLVSEPSGGKEWNPLESGSTIFVTRQFNRYQSFEFNQGKLDGTIHAMEFGLLYDNTDFAPNPSYGSRQYVATSHDWGWFESKQQWSFHELDMSKYFSLGKSDWASQRVIALNFWTGLSPTWEVNTDQQGNRVVNGNPPYNEGATLGASPDFVATTITVSTTKPCCTAQRNIAIPWLTTHLKMFHGSIFYESTGSSLLAL